MIKDHQITSTAPCDNDHRAALARLNNQPGKSSWSGDSHVGAWVPRGKSPSCPFSGVTTVLVIQVGVKTAFKPDLMLDVSVFESLCSPRNLCFSFDISWYEYCFRLLIRV